MAIPVKAGETYYLVVNNAYNPKDYFRRKAPKGFIIYFYNLWPEKKNITLHNVVFASNSAELLNQSFSELDNLVNMLKQNKLINILLKGHTDNVGNENKNEQLSEKRAIAVYNYLIENGIDERRLLYKGYGSSKPLTSNETEDGRKKNRRVEFSLIMK